MRDGTLHRGCQTRRPLGLALFGLSIYILPSLAVAGEWVITPSVALEETFTDNVNSSGVDRESDYITTTEAGVKVVGTGARAKLNFDYSISKDTYLETKDLNTTRQRFLGISNNELWEDHLFLDGRASLSQVSLASGGQQSATGSRDLGNNQTQVFTYSLEPAFRRRYAGWAESDIRYRLNGTRFMQTTVGEEQNPNAAQPNNRLAHEVTTALRSGPRFSRMTWEVSSVETITYTGDATLLDVEEARISKRRTSKAQSEYFINRFVSFRDSLGYEKVKEPGFARELTGVTWTVGSRLTPGPKTELIVDFGQRFKENVWTADASYNMSDAARFTFSLKEEVETEAQSFDRNLRALTTDINDVIIDPVTGLPVDPNASIADVADLTDQTSKTQTAVLSVGGTVLQNNRYNAQVRLLTREFSSATGDSEEQIVAYSISYIRTINLRTTLSTQARYSETLEPRSAGAGQQTVSASVGLRYEFPRELFGELRYDFRHQEPETRDSVTENSATVRLRKQF